MAERNILGLDLEHLTLQEVDEIYKGALFNKGFSSQEALAVAEVSIVSPRKGKKLKSKGEKGEGYDPLFKIGAMMRHH